MHRPLAIALPIAACALLAAGCGSSDSPPSATTSTATSASTVPDGRLGTTSAPPCSRGCDVPVGTYEGKNDQNKAILLHVSVGHLKSGPHIVSTVHVIDRFKTEYLVDCGSQGKANNKVDTTHWGHIDGVHGFLKYGENGMDVFWTPNETIQGVASNKSRACTGSTHFTLKRTGA